MTILQNKKQNLNYNTPYIFDRKVQRQSGYGFIFSVIFK